MARLIGELMQVFRVAADQQPNKSAACCLVDPKNSSSSSSCDIDDNKAGVVAADDEFMIRALTCVFGMEKDGKIKKDRARQVVEKLYGEEEGMIPGQEEEEGGEEVVAAEEVMSGLMEEEGSRKRQELLEEAFRIFDENGNGFIEANELKRVLQCLGLDKGWELSDIEKMMKVVDLNLDGKVDFHEFQLMMMMS